MSKSKMYIFKSLVLFICFSIVISGFTPSYVMGIGDETVNGQDVEITTNENQNEVRKEKIQSDPQKRESLILLEDEDDIAKELEEKGYKEVVDDRTKTSKTFKCC